MHRLVPHVGRWIVLAASVFLPDFAEAGGIVGTGTSASCTEAALDARLAGGGVVTFHCSASATTIPITSTKIISTDTTIIADGNVMFDGGSAVRILSVNPGVPLRIEGLYLAHGKSTGEGAGALHNDGGTVTVVDSVFWSNSTAGGGAAIYNGGSGTVAISGGEFSGNHSDGSLQAIPSQSYGGAIFNASGTLSIADATLAANTIDDTSAGGGGAIANGAYAAAQLSVSNCLFLYNTAFTKGGAIWNGDTMSVTNSTFLQNATDDVGGALYSSGSTEAVTNCTFDENYALTTGASIFTDGDLVVTNSILSRGDSINCAYGTGTITDGGHNIDDGDSCSFSGLCSTVGGTSLCNMDPGLDPLGLRDNGGPTETIGLCTDYGVPVAGCLFPSLAIGAGDQSVCATTSGSAPVADIDQRHFVRPGSGAGACSIGAFEASALAGPCGDGFAEYPEQCDDGNNVDGDCCSSTCTYEAAGSACAEDGSLCSADVCNSGGQCVHLAANAGELCRVGDAEVVTGPGLLPVGAQEFPIAIDEDYFDTHDCGPSSSIQVYPASPSSCVGFHTFTETPSTASKLKTILDGVIASTYSSPQTTAGVTHYELVGGTVSSALTTMKTLYDARKDGSGMWTVLVPVYQASGCANPSASSLIVGFTTARIYEFTVSPTQSILANIDCNIIGIGAGGGPNFGTLYAANADCDVPEYCNGSSSTCPADVKKAAGSACTSDGQACTTDLCDAAGICLHTAGNAGATCRSAAGVCDAVETCDGIASTCPADAKSTGVCRAAAGVCDVAESCDGVANACPADSKSTSVCRASAGVCDVTETCNGIASTCPADSKSTSVCRGSAGVCDVAESCDGIASACPADAKSTAVCRGSAGICDVAESCDGVSDVCPGDSRSTGVCRASAGVCDIAETCDGVASTCPTDAKSTAECRSSAGVCDVAETCDGIASTCPADSKSTAECRGSAGVCDVAETCDGVASTCPTDAKSTAVCRDSAGVCDIAETCDGVASTCPADSKSTAVCRGSAGICDVAETCDGVASTCPADSKSTIECRGSAGVCDVAETCDGVASTCPADAKSTAECRGSAGVCDLAETCDGVASTCPGDSKSTAECRGSAGICDVAETCDGVASTCPADAKSTASCRVSGGVCDSGDETCDGIANDCPADVLAVAGTTCRASAGVCDTAEACNGTTAACPADAFVSAAATCRAASGICDVAETCTGAMATCPADAVASAATECRPSAGECDEAESCNGLAKLCPGDSFADTGTSCSDDADACTDDFCDGAGACAHPPIPLAPVCNWAVVGGSDTQRGRVRTRIESQVGGSICADRADIGESSTLLGAASWALLEDSADAAKVRLNAAVPDGSVVTGGGCLAGFGDSPIFGTLTKEICCADGDVELPGGNPANVINACGLHPLVGECTAAKAQIPTDVAYLDALAATATLESISVQAGEAASITVGSGLSVIDLGRIRLKRSATLTIDAEGNADAVVVLRLANGLSTKEAASIVLAGGALPENVLFYAADGSCSVGLSNHGSGTILCPKGNVKLRQSTEWTGAVAGGVSIDVGWNAKITHVPFLGLAR